MKKQPQGKLKNVSFNEAIDGKKHYDEWAETYDRDLIDEYGYSAHTQVASTLENLVPIKNCEIIDLGCGTGLLGKALHDWGFTVIDGVDFSEGMLEKAKALNIYRNFYAMDLTKNTSLPNNGYDAAVCTGLFGAGHLGPDNTREIIRVVKPGSKVVILMNALPYEEENSPVFHDRFCYEGLWVIKSNTKVNYMDELDRPGRLIIADVL